MKIRITLTRPMTMVLFLLFGLSIASYAQPISATIVLKEGDALAGSTVTSINSNPYNDGVGNVGFHGVLANGARFVYIEDGVVFLNTDAAPDALGTFEAQMGIGNNDAFIISASVNGDDAVWTQNGLLAIEEVQAPGFPTGTVSTFHSRPTMIPDGTTYWVSGFNETGGTSSQGRMLYKASPTGDISVVYRSDDMIGGQTIDRPSGIQFDYAVSENDNHLINEVLFDLSTTNDGALIVDGAIVAQENSPTGDGDDWDNFDLMDINNNGDYVFSGDTDGATSSDEFVAVNGTIVIREGDVVDGTTLTSSAFVRAVALNNDGEVLHTWGISGGTEVLFLGNILDLSASSVEILRTGDMIDTDGDGVGDFTITDFNASFTPSDLPDEPFLFVEVDMEDAGGTEIEAIIEIDLGEPDCSETLAITCPAIPNVDIPDGDCFANIDLPAPLVSGGCGMLEISIEGFDDIPSNFPAGENQLTYVVTDEEGNSESCTVSFFAIEGVVPVITSCPENLTLDCETQVPAPLTSTVEATDNCGILDPATLISSTSNNGLACPGSPLEIIYTYGVTDPSGNTATCEQVITVINNDEPTIAVVPNITVDCFEGINPNPNLADITITCDIVSYDISSPVYQGFGLPSNCPGEQFVVTYTLEDNCGRVATAEQVYTIANDGPEIECPFACEVLGCFDGEAEAVIEAWLNTVTATSSCSQDLTVSNNYFGINGTCVSNSFTPVTFFATDNCGRSSSCQTGIYIVDSDPPVIAGTPTDLLVPCTAITEDIFADWLSDQGGVTATDECSNVSWSTIPANPLAQLNCSNGPQAIVVEFVATDQCGNSSSVTGVFNTKLLPTTVNVSGMIHTEENSPVANVQVGAMSSSMATPTFETTGQDGDFGFPELDFEEDMTFEPSKDNDWLNGVSTFDLILLQQHIIGDNYLDSPYKMIAADANRSGTISTLDLVLLRRLILHIDEEIEDNTSWRFVDGDYVFPNPQDPFASEFPETFGLSGVEEEWADFVAVKIGDLNLDAALNAFDQGGTDRSARGTVELQTADLQLVAGNNYSLDLRSADQNAVNGFQFTLQFDPTAIQVNNIEALNLPGWSTANYNLAKAQEGQILISWNETAGVNLADVEVTLSIGITAVDNAQLSDVFALNSDKIAAEAYDESGVSNLELNFSASTNAYTSFTVLQNQPNPFKEESSIGYYVPNAGHVILEVMDVSGRVVYRNEQAASAGFNQFDLAADKVGESGIYYYRMQFAEESVTKKMILIE